MENFEKNLEERKQTNKQKYTHTQTEHYGRGLILKLINIS